MMMAIVAANCPAVVATERKRELSTRGVQKRQNAASITGTRHAQAPFAQLENLLSRTISTSLE
jgi:hypothetical protein